MTHNHNFMHSPHISTQLSNYILNRAQKQYARHLKVEAFLENQSYEQNKLYLAQCTTQLMHLYNSTPLHQISIQSSREQISLPKHPAHVSYFKKSTILNSAILKNKNIGTGIQRKVRHTAKQSVSKKGGDLQALNLYFEDDEEIEALRLKKQKLYDLQAYFIQSQKQEKCKVKPQKNKSKTNFTTDFNGQKIQIKKIPQKKAPLVDPYFNIELTPKIREEREENRCLIIEQENKQKGNKNQQNSDKISSGQRLTVNCKKQTIESDPKLNITFRDLQSLLIKHKRSKRYSKMNRRSRMRMPEIMSINFIKCL